MINIFKKAEDINRVAVVGYISTIDEDSEGPHATLYKDQNCTDPFTADELMSLAIRGQITVVNLEQEGLNFALPTVGRIKEDDGACVLTISVGPEVINVHSSEYQPLGPE